MTLNSLRSSPAGLVKTFARWLAPTPPEALLPEVERRQLSRIRQHVPLLYLIATFNLLIVMAVCAHAGISPAKYLWMSGLAVLAVVRTVMWVRSEHATLAPVAVSAALRRSAWVAVGSLALMGGFSSWTFVSGAFLQSTLIPVSLAFGSMSIAHCFATVRPSSVAALLLGIVPSAVAMILAGDFNARVLGVSMLSVALLMIRLVAMQFDQLVTEVRLQREVHELAHTDALTNLPNRRSAMGLIEKELAAGVTNVFGVALLDLDGFKGVNDSLGHLAGDELLRVVAQRLSVSRAPTDTVARLGGDEFLVIFRSVQDGADVDRRVATMLNALCQPANLELGTVMVSSSLGYALFPSAGTTTAALLAHADDALYEHKRERTGVPTVGGGERRRHRAR